MKITVRGTGGSSLEACFETTLRLFLTVIFSNILYINTYFLSILSGSGYSTPKVSTVTDFITCFS